VCASQADSLIVPPSRTATIKRSDDKNKAASEVAAGAAKAVKGNIDQPREAVINAWHTGE